jgi:hypothetical protein
MTLVQKEVKVVYVGSTRVRPSGWWWQPWANTLLYFPLTDNSTDVVNNVSMNATWSVTYTTPTWANIKCATFNWSSYLYNSSISTSYLPQWTSNRTMSLWLNFTWSISSWYLSICWYGNDATNKMFTIIKNWWVPRNFSISQYGAQPPDLSWSLSPVQNTWYNLVTTYDWTNWKLYINWTLCVTWTYSISTTWWPIFLWNRHWGTEVCPAWYASSFIIEDKARTAQEVADYYDLTKSLYGIS